MQKQINRQILLIKRPKGMPDEGTFMLREISVPRPGDGQVRIKTRYISVDPYMRGRMNDRKSYLPPFALNEAISGGAVGEVTETRANAFQKGDFVTGILPWQDYSIAEAKFLRKVDPSIAPISTALGILGLTGLTAYFGLLDIGKPRPGETVVVSGAAGAVGIAVGEIAKIKGCHVVGIAGSNMKIEYLIDQVGFDAAVNYKTAPDLRKLIEDACPHGMDIYFDNVGGEISDAVLSLINDNARIPLCGQISMYNEEEIPTGPRIQPILLSHNALMKGFLVSKYSDRFGEAIQQLAVWLKENKLRNVETIIQGLENAPKAFLGLFKGENIGKQIVKVS